MPRCISVGLSFFIGDSSSSNGGEDAETEAPTATDRVTFSLI